MKLEITKVPFMKSWVLAERICSTKNTIPSIAGILCTVKEDGTVTLNATDLKTSICCTAEGVTVQEWGAAIFPLKVVGELFKKIPTDTFTVEVKDDRGLVLSGRNRYSFSTYPIEEFPEIPLPRAADSFVEVPAGELCRVMDEGAIAGSLSEEFPKYLSACLLQLKKGEFRSVSTDGRRLSLSKTFTDGGSDKEVLLPLASVREYQKILGSFAADQPVQLFQDGALTYFRAPGVEFSVRRVESSFPNYEKILSSQNTTSMLVDRSSFVAALERIDVVAREHNRLVVLILSPEGDLKLTSRAPEVGEAKEIIDAQISGEPLKVAFNVGYLLDGLRAFHGSEVNLTFNGQEGQMMMLRPNSSDFLYMLMPIKMKAADQELGE